MDIKGLYKLKDFNIKVTYIFVDFKTCLCNNVHQPAQNLHLEVKLFIAHAAMLPKQDQFFFLMPKNTKDSTFTVNDLFSHTSRKKIRSYPRCFLLSQSSDLCASIPNQLDFGKPDIKFEFSRLSPSSIFLIACNL